MIVQACRNNPFARFFQFKRFSFALKAPLPFPAGSSSLLLVRSSSHRSGDSTTQGSDKSDSIVSSFELSKLDLPLSTIHADRTCAFGQPIEQATPQSWTSLKIRLLNDSPTMSFRTSQQS